MCQATQTISLVRTGWRQTCDSLDPHFVLCGPPGGPYLVGDSESVHQSAVPHGQLADPQGGEVAVAGHRPHAALDLVNLADLAKLVTWSQLTVEFQP